MFVFFFVKTKKTTCCRVFYLEGYCPSLSHATTAVKGRDIGELIILYYRDRKIRYL